jgi:hypothetical protein
MSTLLMVCVLVAAGWLIWRVLRQGAKGTEESHYRTLLQQAGGDRERADRLIDYELRRSPGLTRVKAIQTAIWRLDRDRR